MKRPPATLVLAAALPLLAATAACTDEQRRDIEGAAVVAVIEERTRDSLEERSVEIDDLDCSADIADDGDVTGSCDGSTADGDSIGTTVDGTIDVDEADCSSTLYIDVDGERVVEIADFDCLDD